MELFNDRIHQGVHRIKILKIYAEASILRTHASGGTKCGGSLHDSVTQGKCPKIATLSLFVTSIVNRSTRGVVQTVRVDRVVILISTVAPGDERKGCLCTIIQRNDTQMFQNGQLIPIGHPNFWPHDKFYG